MKDIIKQVWQCNFCDMTFENHDKAYEHAYFCYHNPGSRACPTCRYYIKEAKWNICELSVSSCLTKRCSDWNKYKTLEEACNEATFDMEPKTVESLKKLKDQKQTLKAATWKK